MNCTTQPSPQQNWRPPHVIHCHLLVCGLGVSGEGGVTYVRVEALIALEGGVSETVRGLAVDETGAECSLQAWGIC